MEQFEIGTKVMVVVESEMVSFPGTVVATSYDKKNKQHFATVRTYEDALGPKDHLFPFKYLTRI